MPTKDIHHTIDEGSSVTSVTSMMIRSPWVTDAWPVLQGGFSFPGAGAHMTPKKGSILLRKYRVKMALNSNGQTYDSSSRMPTSHSGTPRRPDHQRRRAWNRPSSRHGCNDCGPGTIDHNAGPLSRHWRARKCDQLEPVLRSKIRRAKIEEVKRIILWLSWHLLTACICVPAPNKQDAADERAGVSDTWAGNLSTGLQESCGQLAG